MNGVGAADAKERMAEATAAENNLILNSRERVSKLGKRVNETKITWSKSVWGERKGVILVV